MPSSGGCKIEQVLLLHKGLTSWLVPPDKEQVTPRTSQRQMVGNLSSCVPLLPAHTRQPWPNSHTDYASSSPRGAPFPTSAQISPLDSQKRMVVSYSHFFTQAVIQLRARRCSPKHLPWSHSRCSSLCRPPSGLPRAQSGSARSSCPRQIQPVEVKKMTTTTFVMKIVTQK